MAGSTATILDINARFARDGNDSYFPGWTAIRVQGVGLNYALFDRLDGARANEGLLVEVADTARHALLRVMDGGCDLVIARDGLPELHSAQSSRR